MPAGAATSRPAANILSYFWDLAAVGAGKRATAATALIEALEAAQQAFVAGGGGADACCPDLEYALRRLGRGLASSRDGARQGFGAALVETLACFPAQVAPEAVLDLVGEAMQLTGSASGNEERDVLYGRLFGCAAVIHSKRLGDLPEERRSGVARRVSGELVGCMEKKSFLQELGAKLLVELIEQLPAKAIQGASAPSALQSPRRTPRRMPVASGP